MKEVELHDLMNFIIDKEVRICPAITTLLEYNLFLYSLLISSLNTRFTLNCIRTKSEPLRLLSFGEKSLLDNKMQPQRTERIVLQLKIQIYSHF